MPHSGPLAGVRVVDLTAMVMGAHATQMMADMGADVIKVEAPEGDPMRWSTEGPEPEMSGIFVNINRGKRGVELDLASSAGKKALRALIAGADVFIHSMRAKAIARLGFDYDAVREIRPDIVYVNGYGYGRAGPYADFPAYDDTIQAEVGLPQLQEMVTGQPGFVATIMADKIAGMAMFQASLLALFHKQRTGEGQEVEVSMFEAMSAFMLVEHANGAIFDPPTAPAHYHRITSPERRPYRTADGHMAAMVYNDRQWNAFVAAVQPEWCDDTYDSLSKRAAKVGEVYANLRRTFATRRTAEWLDLLRGLGIPCAPLRSTAELFDDEHLKAVGFFESVDSDYGRLTLPGMPARFSKSPGKVAGPAPRRGEHTAEVLRELGLDDLPVD